MLSLIKIFNAEQTNSITVNELTGTLKYPVERLEWSQPTRGDELPKLGQGGRHNRYTDVDAMSLIMEGHFLANDTDEYWVTRKALLDIVIPANNHDYRWHSVLHIKLDGDPETYWCYVDLDDYDAPLEALYPTVSPFQFQWTNNFGYWRKLSDSLMARI